MCLQSFALKPNYHISLIYCRPNAKPERVYLYILSRWELSQSLRDDRAQVSFTGPPASSAASDIGRWEQING